MKTAILGGSFNPVHVGHLCLADAVLSGLGYGRVILIPAFQSPFKIGAAAASPEDRLEMLAASIPGDPRLTVDDCELRREGVSFTIDTLKDIIARYRPEGKPGLILGDDLASTFHRWRQPDGIAGLADIIIARRLNGCGAASPAPADGGGHACGRGVQDAAGPAAGFPYPCKALDNGIISISSREVREKIRGDGDWRYLVPAGARRIIEDRRLYGYSGPEGAGAVPEQGQGGLAEITAGVENGARASLDPDRFIHSRNTAVLAWDLCRRFNLDPREGYLAGIAHDICKDMGDERLVRLARADGASISKLEQKKPGLLHGRAAAVLLGKKYGVTGSGILEAVRCHTTGAKGMGPLARIVYIADKIEISRKGVDPALREMARSADLDALFAAAVDNTVAYLRSRDVDISYGTRRLLAAMHKKGSPS